MMCTCTSVYCILSIHLYINVQGRSQGSLGGLHDVHGYIWGSRGNPSGVQGQRPLWRWRDFLGIMVPWRPYNACNVVEVRNSLT